MSLIERFADRWLWIDWAVRIREMYGCDLDTVYGLNVIEFFNYMAYLKDRNELEIAQFKKNTKTKTY